ncbi:TonB-dependent receptor [Thiothrix eikelboomii]|uniref:TonB-dependent receptor n=1 Tax=Thiothrix eikelboomii TaxID=92487 RepID=UPI003BAF178C
MSQLKKPFTLRGSTRPLTDSVLTSSACLMLALPYVVQADTTNINNDEQAITQLEGVSVAGQKTEPGSNPNAAKTAPYKINKSGNNKLTEPLLNVSKTITVVGKEQLEDANTTALRDLMRTQPGITLGTGEGGNAQGDRFIIRGFDARGDLFVDGMRDPGVTTREVFSAEQVEIAKGPSSTFAGRGTTGGAVNSISKRPQANNFTKAGLILGDDKRVTLDANRAVNEQLNLRANLMAQDSEVAGRDEVFDKRYGAALAADYQVNEQVAVLVDYYHLRTDAMPDRGIPWDTYTNQPAKVDRNNFYGIVGRDFQETGADVLTATVDAKLSENTRISSKTRAGKTTNDYIVSTPSNWTPREATTPLPLTASSTMTNRASTAGYTNQFIGNATQITHEFHSGNIEHNLAAGFEISQEKVTNQGYVLNTYDATTNPTGVPAPNLNVLNPNNHATAPGIKGRSADTSKVKAKVHSFYVMDTAKLTQEWEVFGGLRHDTFKIKRQAREGTYDRNSDSQNKTGFVNGHAGIVYKPADNGSIYASISTSSNLPGEMFDAGGVDYGGITPASAALKQPEKNQNLELGTKWDLVNEQLGVTAAVFQTNKKNKIEVTGPRESQVISQTGAVKVRGVELGISGNLHPKLSLAGGAVFMDTEITQSADPNSLGKDLANVAEKSASIQAKYQVTPKLSLGGSVIHTGEIKAGTFAASAVNPYTGEGLKLKASNRLDLVAEYKVNKQLTAQLNVKNATDATIYEALYRSSAPFVYVAPGRTTNLSLTYDF